MSGFRKPEDLQLQLNSPIARFMSLLKHKLHLHRLARRLDDWLRECAKGKEKGADMLHIRRNGLESRKFAQHVMDLIDCMLPTAQAQPMHLFHVHALAYIAIKLRDATALFSRYLITDEQLDDLEESCKSYFHACHMFLDRPVTPTIWMIGHVIPAHARKLKAEIGFHIGTTQGQEGKVKVAKKYLDHTTPANKFNLFFRHEFMLLVWLAQYDPEGDTYHESKESYLPEGVEEKTACHCSKAKPEEAGKRHNSVVMEFLL